MNRTVWTRQDCPICGRTADVKWLQITSAGYDAPTREDAVELDCPSDHRREDPDLDMLLKHRGPHGRISL